MTLWGLFFLFAGFALFVRAWWLPRLGRGLLETQGFRAVGLAGQRAMVGFLGLASLLAGLSALGLMLWLWWLRRTGGGVADVAAGLARLAAWRAAFSYGSAYWGKIALALTVLGGMIYVRRRARVQCGAALQRVREREFERIKNAWFDGTLPPLPPTPAIEKISRRQEEVALAVSEFAAVGDQLTDAGRALLENLREEQRQLAVALARQEIERRIDLRLDPEDVQLPVRRGVLGRVETFFMSRGLLVNLDRTRRALVYGALLLLLPACLGVSVPRLDSLLANRERELRARQVSLDEIQWQLQLEKSRRDWQAELARNAAGAPVQLSAEQLDAINTLAVQLEMQRAGDGVWQAASFPAVSAYQLQSLAVRDRILHDAAARHPDTVAAHTSVTDAAGADRQTRGAVQIVEDIGTKPEPVTTAGKRFAENLRDIASRGTDQIRTRIVQEAHAFGQAATLQDFQRSMFRHFAGAMGEGDGAYFAEVAEQTSWNHRRRARMYEQAAADRASTAFAKGDDVPHAAAAAAADTAATHDSPFFVELQEQVRINAARVGPIDAITDTFARYQPTLDAVVDPAALESATDALEEWRHGLPDHPPRTFTPMSDALSGYPDYFPGQFLNEDRTAASEVRRRLRDDHSLAGLFRSSGDIQAPEVPPVPGGRPPHPGPFSGGGSSFDAAARRTGQVFRSAESATSSAIHRAESTLARSRSFTGLRGFSRVGGVVIGQEQTVRITPYTEGFRWEWASDKTLRFVLRTSDGREHRSVPYRARIAQAALRYAADQRSLAATMVLASPLADLKILLHPALLDTPLGENIIDLDRLVDIYTGEQNGFLDQARKRVYAENALYQLAWTLRLLHVRTKEADSDPALHLCFEDAERRLHDPQVIILGVEALKPEFASDYANPATSPLAVKTEFYEQDFVTQIRRLAHDSRDLKDFAEKAIPLWEDQAQEVAAALGDFARSDSMFRTLPAALPPAVRSWVTPPPEFMPWSGVRELPIKGRLEDVLVEEGTPAPAMLDFIYQVSFTSQPGFLGHEIAGEYQDPNPWQFPAIASRIRDTVLARLASPEPHSPEQLANRQVLADGEEFTRLQRLFRCAFYGQLGDRFPLERLQELSTELTQRVPDVTARTPRWKPNSGALEEFGLNRLKAVNAKLPDATTPDRLKNAARICRQALELNLQRRDRFEADLQVLMIGPSSHPDDPVWRNKWDETWNGLERDLVKWEENWQGLSNEMRDTARALQGTSSGAVAAEISAPILELTAALKMRRAFKVSEEERLGRESLVGLRNKPAL